MNIAESPTLSIALHYASLGFRVIPLHTVVNGLCSCGKPNDTPNHKVGKHPATAHGVTDANENIDVIRSWFGDKPWANVGITFAADQIALDSDPRSGGDVTIASWIAEHGPLPETPHARSGSGGDHWYFRLPPGWAAKNRPVAPGVDTRTSGGYVVAPPSKHLSGGVYEWITPIETPMAEVPSWLLPIVAEATGVADRRGKSSPADKPQAMKFTFSHEETNDFATHPGAGQGERNHALCRLAGIHLDRGDSLRSIEAMAVAWSQRCDPPCDEADVLSKVRALARKDEAKRGASDFRSVPSVPPTNSGTEAGTPGAGIPEPQPPLTVPDEAPETEASAEDDHEEVDDGWPRLDPDALHGLAGDVVKALAPETEADPVALLLTLLAQCGSAIGNGPRYSMNAGSHHGNIFGALVGQTGIGKGQSWSAPYKLMALADPLWGEHCQARGLSSGEGLVDLVKDGDVAFDGFDACRRILCHESELARPITAMRREGNTLSPLIRAAWDSQTLEVLTRGKSKLRASQAHISIVAHITPDELKKLMAESVEVANGFSNRFLWALVRRSNILPAGGDPDVILPFVEPMADAIAKAKAIGRVTRDAGARALWHGVYGELTEPKPGAYGLAVGRGHAQTLRLSLLYALLDGSDAIREEHLRAALALWRYCDASARMIFGKGGDSGGGVGGGGDEPIAIRLLNAIVKAPGIGRRALGQLLPSNKRGMVGTMLDKLRDGGQAHPRDVATGGRKAEGWFPGPNPDGPDDKPEPKSAGVVFTFSADDGGEGGDDPTSVPPIACVGTERNGTEVGNGDPALIPTPSVPCHAFHDGTEGVRRVSDPFRSVPCHTIRATLDGTEARRDLHEPQIEPLMADVNCGPDPHSVPEAKPVCYTGFTPEPDASISDPPPLSLSTPDPQGEADIYRQDTPPPEALTPGEWAKSLATAIYRQGIGPAEALKAHGVRVYSREEVEAMEFVDEDDDDEEPEAQSIAIEADDFIADLKGESEVHRSTSNLEVIGNTDNPQAPRPEDVTLTEDEIRQAILSM